MNIMHRHAFLIMAHNNWYTLERLIRIIDAPWNDIFLHIDSKSKDFCRERFLGLPQYATIRLTKRHNVTWGNESQIKAEMQLFKTAYKYGPYHYYHFLSGSDLPLLNATELYDFFEEKNCNFLQTVADVKPFEWRLKNYINVFRAKWIPSNLRNKLNILSEIVQYKIHTNRLQGLKSRYPILGKGHNWCDLTQMAVEKLVEAKKDIRRFTRFTHCSDEMYKQIVLLNQPEEIIGTISDMDIRFIDWSGHSNHPRTLTLNDYNLLNITPPYNYIYARKFDERVDCRIIDMIFNRVMKTENGR